MNNHNMALTARTGLFTSRVSLFMPSVAAFCRIIVAHKPAFQFYPGDWLKDAALRICSPAARGIWVDLLCLLHECPQRGVFRVKNGSKTVPVSIKKVSKSIAGCKPKMIQELIDNGVVHVARKDGALYSKRLIRDELHHRHKADSGKKGGSKTQANLRKCFEKRQAKSRSSTSTPTSPSTPTSLIEIDKKKSLESRGLGLNKEVKIRAVRFGEELDKIFPNISRDEATTFLRVAQHLTEEVILGAPLEIFDQAAGWAKKAMGGNAQNPKGLFVAKVKEETGFTGRGLMLKDRRGVDD